MALINKFKAIGDAIREKTGNTEALTLDQMAEEILTLAGEGLIDHADIPEYVKNEVQNLIKKIEQVKKDDSIMFIAMSDMHYYNGQKDTDEYPSQANIQSDIGNLHGCMAAKALSYLYDFDFMAYTGDHIHGAAATPKQVAMQQAIEINKLLHEFHNGVPCFHAIGNHDTGLYYDEAQNDAGNTGNFLISGEWLYNNFTKLSDSENTVFGDPTYGGYCYRDFPEKKLRVYLLNTSDYILYEKQVNTLVKSYCLGTQRKWFADSLIQLNEKNDANEWKFIVLSHFPADFGYTMQLSELLRAYKEGTSITISTETGSSHTVNFANQNIARFVAQFHGHIHNFLSSKLYSYKNGYGEQYNAWRIATPNASYNRENYYDIVGNYKDHSFKQPESYGKTIDTGKDTSFVVNIINPSEETIHSLCYGAGIDRIVSYGDEVYYMVYNSLHKITNLGSANIVQEGAGYSGQLVPDMYHTIDGSTIKITMGGVDITQDVYSESVIQIPSVSGDIHIEGIALRPVASYNQIIHAEDYDGNTYNPPYGYTKGYYLSGDSSTGEEILKERANSYITGFMPYHYGQKIQLRDVGFIYNSPNASYNRIAFYDENKKYRGMLHANNSYPLQDKGGGVLNENNEWDAFTLYAGSMNGMPESISYIRFSAEYLNPSSIITFDEDIYYQDQIPDGFTVTPNLTNASLSNVPEFVEYGASYTTTITVPANAQSVSVQVKMGSSNITNSVYNASDLTITIPRVTGNIEIIIYASVPQDVLATAEDTDGTVYNGVGYKGDTYLSSSTGKPSTSAGKYTIGFIKLPDIDPTTISACTPGRIVLTFENISMPESADTRLALYAADKTTSDMSLSSNRFTNINSSLANTYGHVYKHVDASGNITALDITELYRYCYAKSDSFLPKYVRFSTGGAISSSSKIYLNAN